MQALLKKMNYNGSDPIVLLNAPEIFETEMINLSNVYVDINKLEKISYAIIFVNNAIMVEEAVEKIKDKIEGDVILWFCYAKKSSKKYRCDIDRDHGWQSVGKLGFEPVRMVAVDEDFSALRFRRVDYIKKMTRSKEMRISDAK